MNLENNFDFSFKFILVGDTGVGKTSLLTRFVEDRFEEYHEFTIGVEYSSKTVQLNTKNVKLQIWDTAGQQQYKSITRSYYRSSAAALVIFDITRKQTFRNVSRWVEDIRVNSNKDVILVLVGNKCDLSQERMVSRNEALKLARDYEMLYIETSARSKENVERAFLWPATTILDKVEGGFISLNREDQAIKINHREYNTQQERGNLEKDCEC